MNRLLAVFLAASLAVNVWLGWKWAATLPTTQLPPAHAAVLTPASRPGNPSSPPDWSAVQVATALPDLHAALVAAGWPSNLIRGVLWAKLRDKYAAELAATAVPPRDPTIWWQVPAEPAAVHQRRQRRAEVNRKIEAELAALMGDPAPPSGDVRYNFLAADKVRALQQIERDYQELQNRSYLSGEAAAARARLLQEERQRDIAALLTPEELREYDARFGPDADLVRMRLGMVQGTEAEYRALLEVARRSRVETTPAEAVAARDPRALHDEVLRILGRERGTEYLWGLEPAFRELKATAEKHAQPALPADFIDFRTEFTARAGAAAAQAHGEESRRAALRALATEARAELARRFAPEVRMEFSIATEWIDELERGTIWQFTPTGGRSFIGTPSRLASGRP
jgi:hypothetical protein